MGKNTIVPDKWKRFSILHVFSVFEGNAIDFYDALNMVKMWYTRTEADVYVRSVLEEYDATPWEVYEDLSPQYLAELVIDLAEEAADI